MKALFGFIAVLLSTPLCFAQTDARTQDGFAENVFSGFEFILEPIALKWACGGDRDTDLAKIAALIQAFPDDAMASNLQTIVSTLDDLTREKGVKLGDVIGAPVTQDQENRICTQALRLDLNWLEPEHLTEDREGMAPERFLEPLAELFEIVGSISR